MSKLKLNNWEHVHVDHVASTSTQVKVNQRKSKPKHQVKIEEEPTRDMDIAQCVDLWYKG